MNSETCKYNVPSGPGKVQSALKQTSFVYTTRSCNDVNEIASIFYNVYGTCMKGGNGHATSGGGWINPKYSKQIAQLDSIDATKYMIITQYYSDSDCKNVDTSFTSSPNCPEAESFNLKKCDVATSTYDTDEMIISKNPITFPVSDNGFAIKTTFSSKVSCINFDQSDIVGTVWGVAIGCTNSNIANPLAQGASLSV
jgi:hypothetical protein